MLKIKLGEVKGLLEGLNVLLDKEVPIKTSYWVKKGALKVAKEYELFEESRQKLLHKYGKKDNEGQLISENGMAVFKNAEEFHKEYHSLSNTDIELDIKTFKLDDLGDITIAPKTLLALDKVIEE